MKRKGFYYKFSSAIAALLITFLYASYSDANTKAPWATEMLSALSEERVPKAKSDKYADEVCEKYILPQWHNSNDIQSALKQIDDLMVQLDARHVSQMDVGYGWFVYYFDLGDDESKKAYVPPVDHLYTPETQNNEPNEYRGEVTRLYRENGLRSGIQLAYGRGFDSRIIEKDNYVGFAYPIVDVKNLEKFFMQRPLSQPPAFLKPMAIESYNQGNGIPVIGDWHFIDAERRDAFQYSYYVALPAPFLLKIGGAEKPVDRFSITFALDGKRNADQSLTDIGIYQLNCGFKFEDSPAKKRALAPIKDKIYHPEPPIYINSCNANIQWHICNTHPSSELYRATHRSCNKYTGVEPECNN